MRRTHAFTLVELLVVLVVIVLLAGIALPLRAAAHGNENIDRCGTALRGMITGSIAYAGDSKDYLPNGMNSPWVKDVFIGGSFYMQATHGPKQICGVGQLMWGKYLPEKKEAICCPQTDEREDKGFNTGLWMPTVNYTSKTPGDATDLCLDSGLDPASPQYYRTVFGGAQAGGCYCGYAIRGPRLRLHAPVPRFTATEGDQVAPANAAFFADHEGADQKLIPKVGNDPSPLVGWGRVHKEGINTAYLDGHIAMFADEDRSKTWAGSQVNNYGNSTAMWIYDLDYKPAGK